MDTRAAVKRANAKMPLFLWERVAFRAITEYAVHSHIYYELDENIISDHEYDDLCKWLLRNYNRLKPHDRNNYLDKQLLSAGSGYTLKVTGMTRDDARGRVGLPPYRAKKKKAKKKISVVANALEDL